MEYTNEQLKAAYALNLCTVSVSQIIDYNDINIMDQEYEAILNNLNLEEMPKNDALLTTLTQILDTITQFRKQEGDSEYVEREYELKMKNAVWSAIPNFGMLVTGGNLATAAISLASQVGIGYMSYRQAKANNQYEMESSRWQLERNAIDLFNGLRRKLFDTAWKMSAMYGFADELRLSERQIKQYNEILMDNDAERKYERLSSIKDVFTAYPPFWYFFGNAANFLFQKYTGDQSEIYRNEAAENYKKFLDSFREGNLLRENQLASACALEYIELLPCTTEEEKAVIRQWIDFASEMSGGAKDVMQFCALAYIRIGDIENASSILRMLINEEYNTVLNCQLLSSIYVHDYLNGDESAEKKYMYLSDRVEEKYLFPFPKPVLTEGSEEESGDEALKRFMDNQKDILAQKFFLVLEMFRKVYRIRFNKCIPVPEGKEYTDDYYDGSPASDAMRKADGVVLRSRRQASAYAELVQEADYPYNILPVLNDMMNAVTDLYFVQGKEPELLHKLNESIIANREKLLSIKERLESEHVFAQAVYNDMLELTFDDFTDSFFDSLFWMAEDFVLSKNEILAMNEAESNLIEFCNAQGFPLPEELYKKANNASDIPSQKKQYLSVELIDEGIPATVIDDRFNKVFSVVDEFKDKICPYVKEARVLMSQSDAFDRYFINSSIPNKHKIRNKIVAVINDMTLRDRDLLFTTDGIMPVIKGRARSVVPYDEIEVTSNRKAIKLHLLYINDAINMEALIDALSRLRSRPFEMTKNALDTITELSDIDYL